MCRALATSSLPVPLSPVIRTVADVGAICRSRATTECIGGELPITPSKPNRSLSCRWSSMFERWSRCDCEALSATVRSSLMSSGLVR